MRMIYNPISFAKLVQKILGGNYEPIMGIFEKIFIVNLHNLQMLFLLWIKYKFSECLAPCRNMKATVEDFLATILPRSADPGGPSRAVAPKSFLRLPIFCCAQKKLC